MNALKDWHLLKNEIPKGFEKYFGKTPKQAPPPPPRKEPQPPPRKEAGRQKTRPEVKEERTTGKEIPRPDLKGLLCTVNK